MSQTWGLPLPCFFCSLSSLPAGSPSRSETKANQRPSGDQVGLCVLAGPAVKRFASPPALGAIQIAERYSYLRSSMVVTTKATRCPFGEIRGLLRNLNWYRSSIVIGRDILAILFTDGYYRGFLTCSMNWPWPLYSSGLLAASHLLLISS